MIKSNNSSYKQYSVTAVVTAALGVSQPALYGIAIPYKRVMIASIIGGLAGGFYAGIIEFYSYAFVNPEIAALPAFISPDRSEEHTSELQSRFDLVCRLLLEKKKQKK